MILGSESLAPGEECRAVRATAKRGAEWSPHEKRRPRCCDYPQSVKNGTSHGVSQAIFSTHYPSPAAASSALAARPVANVQDHLPSSFEGHSQRLYLERAGPIFRGIGLHRTRNFVTVTAAFSRLLVSSVVSARRSRRCRSHRALTCARGHLRTCDRNLSRILHGVTRVGVARWTSPLLSEAASSRLCLAWVREG